MLYVTTRSRNDAFTAARTMNMDRGPDGGLFIPFRLPVLDGDQIMTLTDKSFGQNVADILNLFFSTKLTGWEVDMAIGRYPCRLKSMNYRIAVAELWQNLDNTFAGVVKALADRLHPDGEIIGAASDWTQVAVRIAVLFGVFAELMRTEQVRADKCVDIAVASGNFSWPMAAWYARKMGLPIGTIVCGCNENSAVWDLLHRGEVDTGAIAVATNTPEGDISVPAGLERLICETCGQEEAMNFFFSCTEGGTYLPREDAFDAIRQGMFAAVVSRVREETIIPGVYRTNAYILDPYSALAYGALSDYRARNGSSRTAVLICDKSPVYSSEAVCRMLRMSASELKTKVAER